jgi:hypothetical protein
MAPLAKDKPQATGRSVFLPSLMQTTLGKYPSGFHQSGPESIL